MILNVQRVYFIIVSNAVKLIHYILQVPYNHDHHDLFYSHISLADLT